MLVGVWVFAVRKYHIPWRALGLRFPESRHNLLTVWVALLGSLAFAIMYAATLISFGPELLRPPAVPEDFVGEGTHRLLIALIVGLGGPFAEEVFFRGFLLTALVPSWGTMGAIIVSSAIFAVAHLMISTMIPIFVTGLLLSWLYLRSRSIWPPVAVHSAQNLIVLSMVA